MADQDPYKDLRYLETFGNSRLFIYVQGGWTDDMVRALDDYVQRVARCRFISGVR